MTAAVKHQRENWYRMPNFVHDWRRENIISKSLNGHVIQKTKSKCSSFIVDWQLNEMDRNPQQLSFIFKE